MDEGLALAQTLLAEARDELVRADAKASMLLSAAGVAGGVLIASGLTGDWDPSKFSSPWATLVSSAAILLGVAGVISLALAVMPRTRHIGDRDELTYFGHVAKFRTHRGRPNEAEIVAAKAELWKAIQRAGSGERRRVVDQLWNVSVIVDTKYRHVRRALLLFGLAGAASFVAIAVEAIASR